MGSDSDGAGDGERPRGSALQVQWPAAPDNRPLYESLFLRAVDPASGAAVWLRHTVQHTPGRPDQGSAWCTLWTADGVPHAAKQTWPAPRAGGSDGVWIRVGEEGDVDEAGEHVSRPSPGSRAGGSEDDAPPPQESIGSGDQAGCSRAGSRNPATPTIGSRLGPDGTRGGIAGPVPADWNLSFGAVEPHGLRHLPFERLYRAPLPKTKVTSPLTGLRVSGTVTVGDTTITLDGAPGVLGHNWGSEHAHRWLWLSGLGFDERPEAWIDVAMARIKVGPAVLPWAGIGALQLDGRRIPLALSARRGPGRIRTNAPGHLVAELPAADGGVTIELQAPTTAMVAWPYAQPGGGELHHALNCSWAAIQVTYAPRSGSATVLTSTVGGVLEQGVPASESHPVAVLPFEDG